MKILNLTLLSLLLSSSPKAATVRGTVQDSMGAAIPKAHIIVHWDPVGIEGVTENVGIKEDRISVSDPTGHFSLELPPGVYDVFVTSAGFFPQCEKITVNPSEIRTYIATLHVSRMLKTRVD